MKKRISTYIAICWCSLFLLACSSLQNTPRSPTPLAKTTTTAATAIPTLPLFNDLSSLLQDNAPSTPITEWQKPNPGIEIKEFTIPAHDGLEEKLVVLRLDPTLFRYEVLQNTTAPKSIEQWRKDENAIAVVNGNYYLENLQTAGYLASKSKTYGTLKSPYNGAFFVANGIPEVRYLPTPSKGVPTSADAAMTNYPMMLAGGKNLLTGNSQQTNRRTIIAQDTKDRILLMISKRATITLFDLAAFLEKSELSIDTALNLDGGPSTGLSIQTGTFTYLTDSLSDIPNVIAVYSKN
jgi:uncharacterized protein YigE (DUF2233 family)